MRNRWTAQGMLLMPLYNFLQPREDGKPWTVTDFNPLEESTMPASAPNKDLKFGVREMALSMGLKVPPRSGDPLAEPEDD